MEMRETPAGKIIRSAGYNSFIPNKLPPQIEWNNTLINTLANATHILGMLAREGSRLPNPHILIRPFVVREAVLSSKIEGTQATLGEVLAQDGGASVTRDPHDLQEVKNYIIALEHGIKRLPDLPLSLRLIKEVHQQLMQGVRGAHATPGEFRRSQNWIGAPGCTLEQAKYVPPSPEHLVECLNEFEKFLHDRNLPPLIQVALCHYQFEAIHPFLDGNGRVGRLLIMLLLIERKILPTPLLYLSAYFEVNRDEYYKQLYNVSAKGTWQDWLLYFLNGVAMQAADVLSRAERINSLITEWHTLVSLEKHNGAINDLIRMLAINPYFTVKKIAENLQIAFTTVQRAVQKLEKLGIILQTTDGKRDRVYCAVKILEILEEPTNLGNYKLGGSENSL